MNTNNQASQNNAQPGRDNLLQRRDFLKLGVTALSSLAFLEAGVTGFMFLRSRALEGDFGGVIKAGEVDSFPPGSVTEFEEDNFFLVRDTDGGFLAVYRRCPHLGCTVNWKEDKERFYCPCHASSFDMYGNFDSQPVQRALDTFPVKIDKAVVKVDTSQLQRRESFTPDQLTYQ
jgi:cytochrome b6-f complex iron-sulfur subunit